MTKGEKTKMYRELKAKRYKYLNEMKASRLPSDREFFKELFELADKQIAQLGMC